MICTPFVHKPSVWSIRAGSRRTQFTSTAFCKRMDHAWGLSSQQRRDPEAREADFVGVNICAAATRQRELMPTVCICAITLA